MLVQVDPDRGVERLVRDVPVPNLAMIGSMKSAAYTRSKGRFHQACISSTTCR